MPFDPQDEGDFPSSPAFASEEVAGIPLGQERVSLPSLQPTATSPSEFVPPEQPEVAQSEAAEAEEEPLPLPEFDSRYREPFDGLLFVGKLTRTFTWARHQFEIRTLLMNEILELGTLHRDFQPTIADVPAYRALVAAACVVSIDGEVLPAPLGPTESDLAARFQFVRTNWYQVTVDAIYEQWLILEGELAEVLAEMGKAEAQSVSIPG